MQPRSLLCALAASFGLVAFALIGCDSGDESSGDSSAPPAKRTVQPTRSDAERKLRMGLHDEAAEITQKLLVANGADPALTLLAAQIELARGDYERAMSLAEGLPLDDDRFALSSAKIVAEAARKQNKVASEEDALRRILALQTDDPASLRRLWQILRIQGRYEESARFAERLAAIGDATPIELGSLITRTLPVADPSPEMLETPLAQAADHFTRGEFEAAENSLSESEASPAATALLMRVLAEQQKDARFSEVAAEAAEETHAFSDYWNAFGLVFLEAAQHEAAVGCLLRALQINPASAIANQRLSQALDALDRREDGEQFRRRGVALVQTANRIEQLLGGDDAPQLKQLLAEKLMEVERPLEALQWRKLALPPQASAIRRQLAAQQQMLATNPEASLIAADSALLHLAPSDFPVQNAIETFLGSTATPSADSRPTAGVASDVVLTDVAAEVGADFQFYLDEEITLHPIPLSASLGGGIGVVDYDRDGWPDVYFTQAGGKPLQTSPRSNSLRRNLGGQLSEVTEAALAQDHQYSSGVAVGDANQDGYPDLFVGALGENRLLINQGDGTFRESIVDGEPFRHTASVAIADLNGDALPDLVEVNYIDMAGALAPVERSADGEWVQQMPLLNFGESDRVFFAQQDGTYSVHVIDEDVVEPGTGLGLIVTDVDDQPGNELFVGNDARANHFLRFDNQHGRFVNSADAIGNALGFNGTAMACMGIATGDFDRNGRIDLHITNYSEEPVNLYLQSESGLFRDLAQRYGLVGDSLPMVGFGTKAVDLDRNGWLDLFVVNGHVFDRRKLGEAFRMTPQLFLATGDAFVRPKQSPGEFFEVASLGRAVVTLDFDRDGDTDFLVGHLDSPTALLRNDTKTTGKSVTLELVGRDSERDAIGARVELETDGGRYSQWVTAGDGYFASDEAVIEFAFPASESIQSATVHWPSGTRQQVDGLRDGRRYLMVEGEAAFDARSDRLD